ncbi:MAG: hypothetical protein SFY92_12470 [Verrucomicrobiae bacterium]|nr:hypothetical protein [Verrucomicrobiae bacterium]
MALLILPLFLSACVGGTPKPIHPIQDPEDYKPRGLVSVSNPREGFGVVNFSSYAMPQDGDVFRVLRDGVVVGKVKVIKPVKPPLASVEILEGQPRRGDLVEP